MEGSGSLILLPHLSTATFPSTRSSGLSTCRSARFEKPTEQLVAKNIPSIVVKNQDARTPAPPTGCLGSWGQFDKRFRFPRIFAAAAWVHNEQALQMLPTVANISPGTLQLQIGAALPS